MLSPTETEFPSAYNTLHVGVALYDPDTGAILDGNDRVELVFGYTTEELRDLSIEEYTANTYPHCKLPHPTSLTHGGSLVEGGALTWTPVLATEWWHGEARLPVEGASVLTRSRSSSRH
jgi:PAS domain-containing protein